MVTPGCGARNFARPSASSRLSAQDAVATVSSHRARDRAYPQPPHHTVVVTKDDEASVFADLERVAPHAAVGYSKDLAAEYKANPARWRPSALQ
jgi:hypothetical protein